MSEHDQGPPMICATKVLQTSGTRIGRIGGIQLPRTVAILVLFSTAIGAIIGLVAAMLINPGMQSDLYGTLFGGGIGWFVVSYSPLKGESMLKWIELQFNTTRRSRYIDGERVSLGVGTALLDQTPRGKTRLLRSAVRIPSTQYDERGVLISAANKNLPADGSIDPRLFAALGLPSEATMTLSPVDDTLRSRVRPRRTPVRTPASGPEPASPVSAQTGSTPSTDDLGGTVPARSLPDAGGTRRSRHSTSSSNGKPRRLKD